MRKSIFLLTLMLFTTLANAAQPLNELQMGNRRILYNIPTNFNGSVALFFHGATGNANTLINDAPTNNLIEKMLVNGFLVVLPEARQDFVSGPYNASWEFNSSNNPDTQFIDSIITLGRQVIPQMKRVYLIGGSGGVGMASRIAKNRTDIDGLVMVNGLDCDQFILTGEKTIATNTNFTIPSTYAPVLMIASKVDELMTFADKQLLIDKARQSGVSAMMLVESNGTHNWGEWTMPYHDNIVNWMKK